MKEEELKRKHRIHKKYTDMEISINKQQTINNKVDNGVRQSRLRLGPLSQWVRLSYLCSKIQKYIIKVPKGLQNDLVCVLLDLKNPSKLTTLKTDE
jgi:hypothetical protein